MDSVIGLLVLLVRLYEFVLLARVLISWVPVSYTHLTLPTIYSV